MTKFDKSKFTGTEYAMYDGVFVARFKRGGRADFLKFLIANYTVEEYFQHLETLPPLKVLELKGYVSKKVKNLLKMVGYPQTLEGFNQYISDQIAIRHS